MRSVVEIVGVVVGEQKLKLRRLRRLLMMANDNLSARLDRAREEADQICGELARLMNERVRFLDEIAGLRRKVSQNCNFSARERRLQIENDRMARELAEAS